jgi:hypothetical protein
MSDKNNLHPTTSTSVAKKILRLPVPVPKRNTFKLPVPKKKIIKFPLYKWTSKEQKSILYKIELLKFIRIMKELGEEL